MGVGLTLDAGALIAFGRSDRTALALLARARERGEPLSVPVGVVGQVWRDGSLQVRLARLLGSGGVEIVQLDDLGARAAGQLCGASRTADVIDATVLHRTLFTTGPRWHHLGMQPDADQLAEAAAATEQLVDAVSADQWHLPTPCSEWTVRELVRHVVGGNHVFADALSGASENTPDAAAGRSADADLAAAYRQSTAVLLDAFRRPGVLEQMVTVPLGTVPAPVALHLRITELLVHGWDLARATGQQGTFPAELAEQELAFSRAALADMPADRRPFSPAEPVAEDAPAIDRLVAQLGRMVKQSPA